MNCAHSFRCFYFFLIIPLAAYQVGLSFLTSHMRRAVAACTSPQVFFGSASQSEVTAGQIAFPTSGDPLGLAMESMDLYSSS